MGRDEISLSEEEDNDALEKVSRNEDDNHSFENISSPEHVTNASDAKLDFENVDSPEEHVEQQHEDLEAVDSPEEDPDDVPSDFRRGLEQSLEAVSSPEPENEATETNASTPDNVKDQSDSSNLDDDFLFVFFCCFYHKCQHRHFFGVTAHSP